MSFIKASSALVLGLLALRAVAQNATICNSYGVDFQDGGVYFQNATSSDDFSFVSFFEGCENDVAYNILVDPNGDEYECDQTNLQPDDTNQLSTCPLEKDQMFSGPWSVLIISNNGDGQPLAAERDFFLGVGTPITVTFTPTITATVISTPITSSTTTTTTTSTTTSTSTTIVPANTKKPTTTITPAAITTTRTLTFGTIKTTSTIVSPIIQTTTYTQTCSFSSQSSPDPSVTFTPTSLPSQVAGSFSVSSATASATTTAAAARRDSPMARRVPADRAARIAARKERLGVAGLEKRGLDVYKTTITDTNPTDWYTVTSSSVAPTSTAIITALATQIQTATAIQTVASGTTTLPTVSITLRAPTKTSYKPTVITSIATVTKTPTYVITVTTAPAQASEVCAAKGGRMV